MRTRARVIRATPAKPQNPRGAPDLTSGDGVGVASEGIGG